MHASAFVAPPLPAAACLRALAAGGTASARGPSPARGAAARGARPRGRRRRAARREPTPPRSTGSPRLRRATGPWMGWAPPGRATRAPSAAARPAPSAECVAQARMQDLGRLKIISKYIGWRVTRRGSRNPHRVESPISGRLRGCAARGRAGGRMDESLGSGAAPGGAEIMIQARAPPHSLQPVPPHSMSLVGVATRSTGWSWPSAGTLATTCSSYASASSAGGRAPAAAAAAVRRATKRS